MLAQANWGRSQFSDINPVISQYLTFRSSDLMELRSKIYKGVFALSQTIWPSLIAILMVMYFVFSKDDEPSEYEVIDASLCIRPVLQRTRDRCIVDHPHMYSAAEVVAGPSSGSDPLPFDFFAVKDTVVSLMVPTLPPIDDSLYGL